MRFIEILDLNDRQVNSFPPKDMYPVIPMDEEMRNINFITTEGKERSFGELIDNAIIPSEARAEKGILYYNEFFSINKVFETEILLTTHGIVTRNPREEGRYILMPYGSFTGVECLGYGNPPQPLIHLVGENESLDLSTQYIAGHVAVKSEEIECLYFILSHFYAGFKETQSAIELDTSRIIYLKSSNHKNNEIQEEDNLDEIIEDFLENYNEEFHTEKKVELKDGNKKEETSIEKIIREWNSEGIIEIEKKDFIHHLSIIYPELKENTIKTMITTMIVNKRTRTYYHGCKKPRKCSEENNYDFLYVNDDNYLTRYEEEKHGIWEIYKRQDGKLDVKLVE